MQTSICLRTIFLNVNKVHLRRLGG
uniref:Uncharacterized protein n=1 Tax=Anguilla anguilla TaxID=7936 RepID=A0A0E9PLY8_ANGAN